MYFSPGPLWDTAYAICSWSVPCFTNVNSLTTNAARSPCRAKPLCPGSDSVQLGGLYPPLPKSKFISQGSHPALYPTYLPPSFTWVQFLALSHLLQVNLATQRFSKRLDHMPALCPLLMPSHHLLLCLFQNSHPSLFLSLKCSRDCDYLPRFPGF